MGIKLELFKPVTFFFPLFKLFDLYSRAVFQMSAGIEILVSYKIVFKTFLFSLEHAWVLQNWGKNIESKAFQRRVIGMRLNLWNVTNYDVNLSASRTEIQGEALGALNPHVTSLYSIDSEKCDFNLLTLFVVSCFIFEQ